MPKKKAKTVERKIEAFEVVEVIRGELKNAPYNPRQMSEAARKKLRKGIKKLGLLAPLTWNAETGNIVGGHQRIAAIDAIKGTKDYKLKVARVRLSEIEEKEANILLNNTEAQGDWDIEALEAMFSGAPDIDIEATGFDNADLFRMFGDSPFVDRDGDALDELAQKISEANARVEDMKLKAKKRDSDDFFLVFVFRDADERGEFIDAAGLEENRYQDGRWLATIASRAKSG